MDNDFIDYFLLLEVHMLASDEAIKASYKRLSAKYHPDNQGDTQKYIQIQNAYSILKDDLKRAEYIEEWKKTYISKDMKNKEKFQSSIYDVSFNVVREIGNEYMFFIMNKEYELAYELLSVKNKALIFKNDFIKWQSLIGEVHELLEFDCIIDTFNKSKHISRFIESEYRIVTLRIRIVEMNLLLNRIEEDFFTRDMVYEEHTWKVSLPNIDIKNIIKKYKRIVIINKKNQKMIKRKKDLLEDRFLAKKLSIESFMNNAEYEFLRYNRYHRVFSMIIFRLKKEKSTQNIMSKLEHYIEKNTRNMDSFCQLNQEMFLVLLPETGEEGTSVVVNKMKAFEFEDFLEDDLVVKVVTIEETYDSLKDLMNSLIIVE